MEFTGQIRESVRRRADELFHQQQLANFRHVDRLFAALMGVQWLAGIVFACAVSPRRWEGTDSSIHPHVLAAVFVGAAISALPIALALWHPGRYHTRLVIAVAQMLWSALLIHLTGGRIETHFHVFGSLAFLAFYRDWRVLVPATLVVLLDHLVRGVVLPQSVYGVLTASPWRSLEHAGWVVFEDAILVPSCLRAVREMRLSAEREALLRESEDRFRLMVEAVEDYAIFMLEPDGRVASWNSGATRMTGYAAEEIVGRHFSCFYPEEDIRAGRHVRDVAAAASGRFKGEGWRVRRDGSRFLADVVTTAVRDPDGTLRGFATVTRDITDRRRAAAAIKEGEERYARIVETAQEGVWVIDAQARTSYVNRSLAEMFGYAVEEMLGRPMFDFMDDAARREAERNMARRRTGVREQHDFRFRRKDGSELWTICSTNPLLGGNGEFEGALAMVTDITGRRRAEEALADKTAQLQAITDAMTAFLQDGDWRRASATLLRSAQRQTASEYGFVGVVVDGKLRVLAHEGVVWNDAINRGFYERALRTYAEVGYLEFPTLQNLFGRVITHSEVVLSNDVASDSRAGGTLPPGHPPLRQFLGVPVRNGLQVVGVIGIANREGGYSTVEQDKIEILTRSAGVLYDSYRRREHEAELEAQRRQAEQVERERNHLKGAVSAMEQVLGVVGHELRTPIAGMQAISELLLIDALQGTPDFNRLLTDLNSEAVRMAETVDELLEAARLNSGQARWKWSTVPLPAVCEQALASVRALVDADQVRVTVDVEPPDCTMRGDADALRRLILNLANNARKHTARGSIHVGVRRTNEAGAEWIEVRLRDTGSGIAPEILERLGEAFALNSGVVGAGSVSGTGLGLAICKRIAAAHGGQLHVDSAVGKGTTVIARLRADLVAPVVSQGKGQVLFAA